MKLPVTSLRPLFESLPVEFRLTVCDVGSIGGLHHRWKYLRKHLVTVGFDPLDEKPPTERERIFPFLVGESDGIATLLVTRRTTMSSTLQPNRSFFAPFWNKTSDVEVVETIEASSSTLDALLGREAIQPDAIKIDVQGGEGAVLLGASETLRRSVLLAEIECSFAERYEGQQTIDQIMARMRELGFALLDLRRLKRYRYRNDTGVVDPSIGKGMRAGRLAFCDAIFILEDDELLSRIDTDGNTGLKAIVLAMTYGKLDLAAALFDRTADRLPPVTRDAFASFFKSMSGDGGWIKQLHHRFDAWAQRV